MDTKNENLKYLKLLSKQYPSIASASTEIINLEAILNLPKGTEHFLADIHGESEQFVHVLRNGSGAIRRKIDELYNNSLLDSEKRSLATLVYYPEQKLEIVLKQEDNISDWYRINLYRLIELCRYVSSKYTRSKVRKALPKDFSYILEELLHEDSDNKNKHGYYDGIINTIIEIERAKEFITALCHLIQRFVIDRLHIIGDIFDRGPRPDIIIDTLIDYHSVDIQWGNHDILWMGAACGNTTSIANVLRIATRYSNLDVIEDIYGINILPLATFALKQYQDDPCTSFIPKNNDKNYGTSEIQLVAKMHKAITIIQFKLEYEIIKRRPEFKLDHRLLLDKINYNEGTISLNDQTYELSDKLFPTVNPEKPFELTPEERKLIDKLQLSFLNSDKLQKHVLFLFNKGSIYLTYNSNLLFHGCIPLNKDMTFKSMILNGESYKGKALLDTFDCLAREGYFSKRNSLEKQYGMDILWYLWTGECSSLFGKKDMATFERYFIKNEETHIEKKNPYYEFRDSEEMCNMIFKEFNLNPSESRIINGHVPVKDRFGESPVKSNGKLIVIDGGFAKAYRKETGISGYTLIYNSYGLQLICHESFRSIEDAFSKETDIHSSMRIVEKLDRKKVGDTDIGKDLKNQINDLKLLLDAYRKGLINELI
ncbi:fructose-bisphosphatase class III [Clostridium butyricum]|uniref:Fructose-1,6-bisphosphatase class 3 n=2 Tax=Clostridium butyricum TaxID=1492 RepID=A0A0A6SL93_CLOBU|nr:fructose-bisphosphatase class III [Clostridium butyricum]KHD13778.1 fructose 1,6-bisphosphatase [Clostridium butyricum]KHD16401.1 fructose 1,6-bisphosphatase [Clostridium butyricum]MBZ0313923.1 fructose-bisphosphatase class III [Clostridium butyricum]PPV11919.1 fructose 1,6-bisphosphatase [Clostridium butyricum]